MCFKEKCGWCPFACGDDDTCNGIQFLFVFGIVPAPDGIGQKTILLPVVKGDELELRIYAGRQNLKNGEAYHIEEPTGEAFTAYEKIDLAIIPGVSFDAQGNRLGRGKGYYDKLLPLLHSYNIGICYNFQVSEKLPVEPFDRRMDEVWTENGILK